MKVAGIDTMTWEAATDDRGHWRAVVKTCMRRGEDNRPAHEAENEGEEDSKPSPPSSTNYLYLPPMQQRLSCQSGADKPLQEML